MPTLWKMLTKKEEEKEELPPIECRYYNPLNARIGHHVKIDTIDLEDLEFHIRSIREVKRVIGDQEFLMADYELLARPIGGDDPVTVRLRLVPLEDADGELTHNVILLRYVDECGYEEEFHESLAFEANGGEFTEGDDKFFRVNDLKEPFEASIVHLSDEDNSGEVDENEVREGNLTYWDFWRECEESGNKVIEFYIIEMDVENGFFTFWRGQDIDPGRIEVS